MLLKLVAVLTATLLITPPCAWAVARSEAGSAVQRERARKLFAQAEWHFSKARYRAALRDYDRAFRLSGLTGFLLNMAHCQVRLNNVREARRIYRMYLQRSPEADPRRADVRAALAQLDGRAETHGADANDEDEVAEQDVPTTAIANAATAARSTPRPGPPPQVNSVQLALVPHDGDSASLDLRARSGAKETPLQTSPWVWALAGAAVVAASVAVFLVARPGDDTVREGSLGTLSR